jgi:hypothetical protein
MIAGAGLLNFALSAAMLAAFALLIGGGWLLVGRRERKQGALMIGVALVLIANVLIWAMPIGPG